MSVGTKQVTAYTSAARTATPTAATVSPQGRNHLHLIIDVTAIAGGSVTPTIDAYDDLSGKYYNLLTGAAIVGTGTTVLRIGPGAPVTANVSANSALPGQLRVTMTHADASSTTYTVNAILMAG